MGVFSRRKKEANRKEVSIMANDQWHVFMQNSDYKKYQTVNDSNKPYLDNFQRNLMEKYQLRYFREHPIEDELNRQHIRLSIKISK